MSKIEIVTLIVNHAQKFVRFVIKNQISFIKADFNSP